jgi:hypothetical protein
MQYRVVLGDSQLAGSPANNRSFPMANGNKPGSNSGNNGGIYREQGPRGGLKDNFTTIPEHRRFPPTSQPDSTWVPVKRTPHGSK